MNPATATEVEQLAERYGEAWNAHDVDRILSMHTDDMAFQLHLLGYPEVSGDEALREHFAQFFTLWPDLEFRTTRLTFCDGLFANEMTMVGTLSAPMPLGDAVLEPTGKSASFDAVDVIPVEGGTVKRKDTYVDAASLLAQLGALERG